MQTLIRLMLCILLLTCLHPLSSQLYADEKISAEPSEPLMIDPYQKDVLNFLDIDINQYLQKAWEAYQEKNYSDAAKYYIAYLKHDFQNAKATYNLACCYGLLGKDDLAAKSLERAFKAGFTDLNHIMIDTDFDKVKESEAFKAVIDGIKKKKLENQKDGANEVIYLDSEVYLKCNLHFPQNYDSTKSYPLIVGLHGYGDNLDNFIGNWKRFGDIEFIYAVPQAPYPITAGRNIGYSWALNAEIDTELNNEMIKTTENYIVKTVRLLKDKYNIDDTYLFGFSQGCFFTYQTGIRNPRLFKGLICFGGWLNTDIISEKEFDAAKDLKVFIGHGKTDNAVPYKDAVTAKEVLASHGYEVTFKDFDGGHIVSDESMKQVVEWIK